MYYGIDYGMGKANRNPKTGIRNGVIPMNRLNEWAYEEFEADYGEPACPECGGPLADYDHGEHGDYEGRGSDYACVACLKALDSYECTPDEPLGYYLDNGTYKAVQHSNGDVFVVESPYYTHAQFCSPCAPGACYLLSPTDKGGPKAYCLGHDWFGGGKAPYPIWEVATGKLVRPEVEAKT